MEATTKRVKKTPKPTPFEQSYTGFQRWLSTIASQIYVEALSSDNPVLIQRAKNAEKHIVASARFDLTHNTN